ncbi:CUGBP Elav-like family member 2 isoform X3 [Musca domestica]|uniref:CUGBP Elav-like family member 2 isoform X3 n=3 Tax=Musca domestica TaxID=7370 RepID=A0ABM3V434_MUSDO|nr:CUGBP Elav-like family member 2 isoform X3 [Musca domestica]
MLSSLDALASKISPGSGNNSPSQQQQQQQQSQSAQVQQTLSRSILRSPLYQTDLKPDIHDCPDSQSNQSLRLNGNQTHHPHSNHHHHQQHHHHNNGLDSNGNKLCHITHNSIHPYHKQPNSPNNGSSQQYHHQPQHQQHHSHQHQSHHNHLLQQAKLANYQQSSSNSSPPTTPLPLSSLSPQECAQQRQQQHELFQQQLQQQQQQQQQLQQQRLQQQSSASVASPPMSPPTPTSQSYDENDSQHEFGSCLKENAFGMSDKSSTTNSLPNSPIHNNNNNTSLLNKNNAVANLCSNNNNANAINNNNNNTCSTNRNLMVVDGESCFRMDTDGPFLREEPDPDNIKMFVGQVPKSMDEAQLRAMFEEYGPVHSINVLRDKATGISKGCCFVTFYTRRAALKAQDALHNVKTLNGMYHPIQMKPADSENRNERKLFIGMLNKKLNENDVRKLFEVHGAIEECTVLRDQNGQSKGCAFVTYATKHSAISAIKVTLNQNKTMEGCTSPLVVKFADTQKEKEQKKIQQIQANLWNLATNMNIPLGQTATTVSTPAIMPSTPQQASPVLGADAITPASLQLLQQLQAVGLQQQLLQGLGAQTNTADTTAATAAAAAAGLLPPMTVQNLAALAAMTQSSLTNTANNPGNAQLTNTAALLWADANNFASAYMSTAAGLPQFGSTALTTSPLASVALSSAAAAAAGKQIEGPEGCNLFIYHLPQEFTDTDLASTFLPFGNVISAKVFIDKQTNLSKCFGFVSFDNPESAQVAIRAMNGFQVGTKRLKVQLKKPKDASKPY